MYGQHLPSDKTLTASVWARSPSDSGNCYVSVGVRGNDQITLGLTSGGVVGKGWGRYQLKVESGMQSERTGVAYFYVSCVGGAVAERVDVDDFVFKSG